MKIEDVENLNQQSYHHFHSLLPFVSEILKHTSNLTLKNKIPCLYEKNRMGSAELKSFSIDQTKKSFDYQLRSLKY